MAARGWGWDKASSSGAESDGGGIQRLDGEQPPQGQVLNSCGQPMGRTGPIGPSQPSVRIADGKANRNWPVSACHKPDCPGAGNGRFRGFAQPAGGGAQRPERHEMGTTKARKGDQPGGGIPVWRADDSADPRWVNWHVPRLQDTIGEGFGPGGSVVGAAISGRSCAFRSPRFLD